MDREAEEFWREYERTTGEAVQARAMGEWLGPGAPKEGVWGILILTDRSFHFMGRKAENWVLGLFGGKGRKEAAPVEFRVPRGDLAALEEPRRGFFARLLGSAFPEITLSWNRAGEPERAVFTVDDQQGFIAALRGALPR